MTDMASRSDCTEANSAEWLAWASHELDEISRSLEPSFEDSDDGVGTHSDRSPSSALPDASRVVADRSEIVEHAQSLRRRLALVTRDPHLAVRLQAELSQLRWTTRICLRQLRLANPGASRPEPDTRAS